MASNNRNVEIQMENDEGRRDAQTENGSPATANLEANASVSSQVRDQPPPPPPPPPPPSLAISLRLPIFGMVFSLFKRDSNPDDDELMLNVLRCHLIY